MSDMVITLDPGEVTGWAVFTGSRLAHCGTTTRAHGFRTPYDYATPDVLVVEMPTVYPDDREKANNLLVLATTVGRYLERWARCPRIVTPRPRDWKGGVPKAIHNSRTVSRLSEIEQFLLANKPDHNMLDAIGLGLWHLKRG